ncbi:hypothetical protein TKK_0015038 [Trichogramma kaykai]
MNPITSMSTNLENFDCDGDPASVSVRWEKWKRALSIFLTASNVEKPEKKRACLLHVGGLGLQDVYYNIPGAHVDETEGNDIYEIALSKLDEYFAPKQSNVYERHIFRKLTQGNEEKFEKFLIRLRDQAEKCQFINQDEHIIDQITEKCNSVDLRKEILMVKDKITLDKIIRKANALEAVNRQIEGFTNKSSLNENDQNTINKIHSVNSTRSKRMKIDYCTRCGSKSHQADNKNCPAIDKRCNKCNFIGHFREQCRSKRTKNNFASNQNYSNKTFKSKKDSEFDYIFHIENDDGDDSVVQCSVGSVKIKMLIDSGSKHDIISDKTWNYLKLNKVQAFNQVRKPDKVLKSYGNNKPLIIIGSFETIISLNYMNRQTTIYVIKDGTRDLLGKHTAIALGVLKIGLHINNITTEFPKFKNISVEIPIDETVKPVIQPHRRIPIPLENKVNSKLEELLRKGIIEEVNGPSQWVSPMVPILKENGEIRICIDMRRANAAIKRENHPLPTMSKLLPSLRGAKYFSRLDIKDAFHQIEIHKDSRNITTFSTSKGLYRYKRLMFGITCAPEIFQKILEKILLKCDGSINFIDDILVFGADSNEHDKRLEKVQEVLQKNGIQLNRTKCLYRVKKIQFLGHELSENGVKPLSKYIDSVVTTQMPTTIEEVQSFLGLINFVGKWIPNLATLTEPFRELLRLKLNKSVKIQRYITNKHDEALIKIKDSLQKISTLGYYNPHDRTQVMADASPVGLGAVLIQIDNNGPRIIAFGNKSLTDCEKRYCQTEKEVLALVWAVEHFKIYLFGKVFELITDHKPLEVIFGEKSKPCAKIDRWVLRLQAYQYKIIYKPGKSNIADPFSRLCKIKQEQPFDNENYINLIVEYSRPVAVSLSQIRQESRIDRKILLIRKGLYENIWDQSIQNYKIFQTELCFQDEILLRGNKIVIPENL